ncbi:MAG: ferrochelatase [Porticoccaceae bacterium]
MAFRDSPVIDPADAEKTGVLLINLGTPDAPTTKAVRKYLGQFLWDPRVVEIPRPLWWLILNGIILRTRPAKSARNYQSVWTEQGSPLLVYSFQQRDGLRQALGIPVEIAMRYGNPTITSAVNALVDQGVRRILALPLYPQYSATTTASAFEALAADFSQRRWLPELRFINQYHDFAPYISACADAIRDHWQQHGQADKLVLSFHGVPKFHSERGDPYFLQCQRTSQLIAENLGLAAGNVITTFQSRFGKAEWLQPYTDKTLQSLPAQGVRSVAVFCPGFSADCLETLEEIAVENRQYFLAAGGETFHYIPALNAASAHIDALAALIERHLQGWA